MPGQGYVNSRVAAIGRVIAAHFVTCGIDVPGYRAFKEAAAVSADPQPEVSAVPTLPKGRQRDGCPNYGNCNIISEAGCTRCLSCDFSRCE